MGFEELKQLLYGDHSSNDIDWIEVKNDYIKFMKSDAPKEQREELDGYGEMIGMFVEQKNIIQVCDK